MTAIIKNKFRLKNAKSFIENFEVPRNNQDILAVAANLSQTEKNTLEETTKRVPDRNHYLFVGKPFGWDVTNLPTNTNNNVELNPPTPVDTQHEDSRIWDEMLGLKKLSREDLALVIPRSDWRPNTVYATFDGEDADLYRQPSPTRSSKEAQLQRRAGNFYILNNMMELFICVDNNNDSVSTVPPMRIEMNGQNSNINGRLRTSDGYVWQYITTLSAAEAVKFLTDSWIPIKTLPQDANLGTPQEDVQQNAIPGELLRVSVTSPLDNTDQFTPYVGKVQKTTNSNELVIPNGANIPVPVLDVDAYTGYEILIKESGSDTGDIVARYKIVSYATTPAPTLTIDTNTNNLSQNVNYDCEILPLINIETNGESTVALKPILNPAGKITSIKVLNPGSKSTTMKLSVNKPLLFTGTLPSLRAVLSPPAGLGRDPESDLGAFFAMMSTQLKYDEGEGDFPIANDYRQIGIIRDVKKIIKDSNNQDVVVLTTENTLNATTIVNVRFDNEDKLGVLGLGFQSDDVVEIKNSTTGALLGKAKVVQFIRNVDSQNDLGETIISGKLFVLQTIDTGYCTLAENQTFVKGDVEADSFSPNASTPAIIREEFLKFDGDILFIENRRAVLRSIDQIEDIKTIIEF